MNMQLSQLYSKSTSEKQFFELLGKAKLEVYVRNGTIAGIQGERRRYRLKTIGFSKERLQALDLSENKRQQELQRIIQQRIKRNKDVEHNR